MLQYIGARYVPIFYQNSLDPTSSEWEPNVTYEPMVWVEMSNGHMYISKKTVPANIGSPASNPEYWLEAGQYNAYIQHLQDQIDDMNDGSINGSLQNQINAVNSNIASLSGNIGTLSNLTTPKKDSIVNSINSLHSLTHGRKIITIGDSYNTTDQTSAGDHVTPWGPALATRFGLTANVDWFNSGIGGSGFVNGYDRGENFISQLQTIGANITNKEEITDIVVAGGTNDQAYLTDFYSYFEAFSDYCAQYYPNARVWVFYVSWRWPRSDSNVYSVLRAYYSANTKLNTTVDASAFECLLHVSTLCNDHGHPNALGAAELARYFHNALTGMHRTVVWRELTSFTCASPQNYITGSIKEEQNGNQVTVSITPTNYSGAAVPIVGGYEYDTGLDNLKLCNPINGTILGQGTGYVITSDSKVLRMDWVMEYRANAIIIIPYIISSQGYDYYNGNITRIFYKPSIKTFSSDIC